MRAESRHGRLSRNFQIGQGIQVENCRAWSAFFATSSILNCQLLVGLRSFRPVLYDTPAHFIGQRGKRGDIAVKFSKCIGI
jgi:hypothetical protein